MVPPVFLVCLAISVFDSSMCFTIPFSRFLFPLKIKYGFGRMYAELVEALNEVGFSGEEQRGVHETLAAILHTGNLSFDAVYSDTDPANISSRPQVVTQICQLIGCSEEALKTGLLMNIQVTRGETIRKPYTCEAAADVRDAFAKALYGRLFGWIVSQINELLAPGLAFMPEAQREKLYEIGILDIFGFEHFAHNG